MKFYLYLLISRLYTRTNIILEPTYLKKDFPCFDTDNSFNSSTIDNKEFFKIKENFRKHNLLKKLENPKIDIFTKLDLIKYNFDESLSYDLTKGLENDSFFEEEWE